MEPNNGKGKNVVIVVLLYLVMNKKGNQNVTPEVTPTPQENINDEPTADEPISGQLTDEVKQKLFNSLLTPSKEYGLYFKTNVSINNIDNQSFLKYALENFVVDKKIKMNGADFECIWGEMECDKSELNGVPSASVAEIQEYIKNKYNTTRSFDLTGGSINGYSTGGYGTFYGCSSLTTLDLSSWNTKKSTDLNQMFYYTTNLETIYASEDFDVSNVSSSRDMFYNDTKLVGGAGTTYNSSKTDKEYAHIDGGASNPGYFTSR